MFTSAFEKAVTDSKDAQNWLANATKEVFSFQQAMVADWTEWTRANSVRSYSAKTVEELVDVNLSSISDFTQRSSKVFLDSMNIVNALASQNPFYQMGEGKISKKKAS
ncbi:hypothetical protein [Piscirickettsia litoralis]|uniref:Phasin domain-containing protein n=1 Tax=Piscirickettsia litoralis TaxID=1891921 RepID=A0ABX3A549_9GAMM|nr:hypothetical protein [Piscirickettsia litoralis]ODN43357.1 hypothetical protein BGC07_11015 [Piscirickettsia litoralis]